VHTTANRRRLDRHEFYVGVHASLVGAGVGLALTPAPAGALSALSALTDHALALCMISGSVCCLAGAAMPMRYWFPRRGLDMRNELALGMFGMTAVAFALIVWGVFIVLNSTLVGSLGGSLAIGLGISCYKLIKRFWRERREVSALRGVVRKVIAAEQLSNGAPTIDQTGDDEPA
jgi:hypothetical protein